MPSWKLVRTGILCAVLAATCLSCGENQPTEPNPVSDITAVKGNEQFLNSPQQESRELLIDGRVTDIEWAITGDASIIRMQNEAGERGGTYYLSVRSLWTVDRFNNPSGILFLLQWPDPTPSLLHMPLVTTADVVADNGDTLIDCTTGNTALVNPANWTINRNIQEDDVTIEIFSTQTGGYPKDVWRWGANTTDPGNPVNGTEFTAAGSDSSHSLEHPNGSYMEDFYDNGSGPVRDFGDYSYMLANHESTDYVPLKIASKNPREVRFNRGKPIPTVIWETVSKDFGPCETINPIRVDDATQNDKTWNPGDYQPSFRMLLSTGSQADVVARGAWNMGKWGLEIRRDLIARFPSPGNNIPGPPHLDDIQLVPGQRYAVRFTIVDGTTKARSVSDLIPIYLRP
jgi:ethylbenzene dehydrogenase